jgi:hypothetical protein
MSSVVIGLGWGDAGKWKTVPRTRFYQYTKTNEKRIGLYFPLAASGLSGLGAKQKPGCRLSLLS